MRTDRRRLLSLRRRSPSPTPTLTGLYDPRLVQCDSIDASLEVGDVLVCHPYEACSTLVLGTFHLYWLVDPNGGVAIRFGVGDDTTRSGRRSCDHWWTVERVVRDSSEW